MLLQSLCSNVRTDPKFVLGWDVVSVQSFAFCFSYRGRQTKGIAMQTSLEHDGFIVSSVDKVLQAARTGSLWYMSFGRPAVRWR
jgi:hypothetical protein